MAAAKDNADGIVTVELEGVEVQVDTSYTRTWEGVHHLRRMRDTSLSDDDRFFEVVDYYDRVVVNADEVAEKLGGVDANAIYDFMGKAVREAAPKN